MAETMDRKRCSRCKLYRDASEFSRKGDGLQAYCRRCITNYRRDSRRRKACGRGMLSARAALRTHVVKVLTAVAGNRTSAAEILEVSRQTLQRWVREWGLGDIKALKKPKWHRPKAAMRFTDMSPRQRANLIGERDA